MLNNGVYQSTGGQPTVSRGVDLCAAARAAGYAGAVEVRDEAQLEAELSRCLAEDGPHFIRAYVGPGGMADASRPNLTPEQLKDRFRAGLGLGG